MPDAPSRPTVLGNRPASFDAVERELTFEPPGRQDIRTLPAGRAAKPHLCVGWSAYDCASG